MREYASTIAATERGFARERIAQIRTGLAQKIPTSETNHDQKPLATNKVLQKPGEGCRSMNGRWCGCGCDFCQSDKPSQVLLAS